MTLNSIIKNKEITKYRLSKDSGVPYTTINDICNGKTKIEKCSAETVYKISKSLGITMEELIEACFEERISFELYKSNVCHRVKELGDIEFIIETLEKNEIRQYYKKKWYPESFYLLAMLDYISRLNNVMICTDYDDIRRCKLDSIIYPAGVLSADAVSNKKDIKKEARLESIPEFMRFNIVESEVRNIV